MQDKVVLFIGGIKNVNLSPNCGSTFQKDVLCKHQKMTRKFARGYLCYKNTVTRAPTKPKVVCF